MERVGGIEDDFFFQLQEEGVIEPWFDYYSDFRWRSEIVNRMLLKLLQKSVTSQSHVRTSFIGILQKAADAKSGLMAFGD